MLNQNLITEFMITSLRVKNYRCFKDLKVNDLGLINIIAGDNGAGKTALLESIILPAGNPQYVFQLRNWRGVNMSALGPTKSAYEAVWKDLFFQFSHDKSIEISLEGTPENSRVLKIYYGTQELTLFPPGEKKEALEERDSTLITPLTFETTDSRGVTTKSQTVVQPNGGITFTGGAANPLVYFYPASSLANAAQVASQFSSLSKKNQGSEISDLIRTIFPQIGELSVEVSGNMPELHSAVSGMPEKMPLGLVSNGINKLVAILLAITSHAKGIVLIDEIENGIYYQKMPKMWQAIFQFCQRYQVQLFASTHSLECLKALIPVMSENEKDFRLLRVEDGLNGSGHVIRMFKGKNFEAALETGVEVR